MSMLVALLTVPLTVSYLGTERYGLWLTLSSLIAMLSFADLGLGNGLRTMVADADGRGDRETIVRLASTAIAVQLIVATGFVLSLVLVAPGVNWAGILKITSVQVQHEVFGCVLALGITFFLAMPLQVGQSIQIGLQQGYAATIWATLGSCVSLIALILATNAKAGVVMLILVLSGVPLLAAGANTIWFFWRDRPDLRPRLAQVRWTLAVRLLRTGAWFVVLQVASAFAFTTDNVVVGSARGASTVPELAVPAKLFGLVPMIAGMFTGPLWPAFGEAASRGDVAWVRRTLSRAIVVGLAFTIASAVVLLAVGQWLVLHWSRGHVQTNFALLVPLALWTIMCVWGSTVSAFLNGTGEITVQALAATTMAVLAFALKWLLIGPLGVSGVVWATVFAYGLTTVGPTLWAARRVMRRLEGGKAERILQIPEVPSD